jgi:hypothetical protein
MAEVAYYDGNKEHYESLGLDGKTPAFVVPENAGAEIDPAERWRLEMVAAAHEEALAVHAQMEADFDEANAMNAAFDAAEDAAYAENRRFDRGRGRNFNAMYSEAVAENREREDAYVGHRRVGSVGILASAGLEFRTARHRESISDRFQNAQHAIGRFASRLVAPLRSPQVAMTSEAPAAPITVEYRTAPAAEAAPTTERTSRFSSADLGFLASYGEYRSRIDDNFRGMQLANV